MIKSYKQYSTPNKKIIIKNNKFKLFVDDVLVGYCGFNVEQPDKWFGEKYVTLFDVYTIKKFRGKGFMKLLLRSIFNYVKNKLNLNIITLLVYKNNYKAVNLYFKCGFGILVDYDDEKDSDKSYYNLIKMV